MRIKQSNYLIAFFLIFFTGCDYIAYITDNYGVETKIDNLTLSQEKFFSIVSGESYKNIPITSIRQIEISNEEFKTIAGKLYFLASVELADGTLMKARKKDGTPLTFICTNNFVTGTSHNGDFSINLANVSKLRIEKK
jgi:hypothetical protein